MRFNLPRLIGITGKAGTGKDTLADYLVRQHGFVKYSLASPIKKLLNDRFGWTNTEWQDREWKEAEHPGAGYRYFTPPGVFFSPRSWAQWLGTEVGREIGGEDVWVNMMENEWAQLDQAFRFGLTETHCMVIPDIRFDNEARRVHSLGGVVIRVTRPAAIPVAAHVSEQGVSDELVNVQVENNKDIITYLRESVYALESCPRGA